MKRSRRYLANAAKIEQGRKYSVSEAVHLLKSMQAAKYNEAVEVAMKLGVDPRKADQAVRGTVVLPKGLGKKMRVIVFAQGESAEEALAAGAMEAGGDELAKRIEGGWMDFDVAIAHPSMMSRVGKLGRILGPKGLMPSPKSGTVTTDVVKAVEEFSSGKVEYRVDSGGNLHVPVGKLGFAEQDLVENIQVFTEHIRSNRPVAAKGTFLQKVHVSTSTRPSVAVEAC